MFSCLGMEHTAFLYSMRLTLSFAFLLIQYIVSTASLRICYGMFSMAF